MLDLFSGTGSVGEVFRRRGYEVVSLDSSAAAAPTILADIRQWRYWEEYQPGDFDVIAAGVPCQEYSTALTTRPRRLEEADELVAKTFEIIDSFKPRLWWVENPRHGLLRHRPVVAGRPYLDADYCCFSGWGYQKPNRIWGSPEVVGRGDVLCDGKTCPNLLPVDTKEDWHRRPHRQRLGGDRMRFDTRAKFRMPQKLVEYLAGFDHETTTEDTSSSDSDPGTASPVPGAASSCSRVETASQPQPGCLKKKKAVQRTGRQKKSDLAPVSDRGGNRADSCGTPGPRQVATEDADLPDGAQHLAEGGSPTAGQPKPTPPADSAAKAGRPGRAAEQQ